MRPLSNPTPTPPVLYSLGGSSEGRVKSKAGSDRNQSKTAAIVRPPATPPTTPPGIGVENRARQTTTIAQTAVRIHSTTAALFMRFVLSISHFQSRDGVNRYLTAAWRPRWGVQPWAQSFSTGARTLSEQINFAILHRKELLQPHPRSRSGRESGAPVWPHPL